MGAYPDKRQRQNRRQIGHAALGLLLITFLAFPALAADPAPAHATDFGASGLNLTTQQQQKLAALENASHAQAGQMIGQIEQIRRKLADLYGTYDFDVNAARRLNQDLNRVQGQLLDLRLSEQQKLRGILSPDQFAQLQAAIHKPDFRDEHDPDDMDHDHGHRHWPHH